MNKLTVAFIIVLLQSCYTIKNTYSTTWVELTGDNNYLLTNPNITDTVVAEVNKGSIVLMGDIKGDFQEICIFDNDASLRSVYWIHKPQYKKIGNFSPRNNDLDFLKPFESSESYTYYTGPRGGCYYINSRNHKVYVNRYLCSSFINPSVQTSPNTTTVSRPSTSSSSGGGDVRVKSHTRTTKSGKVVNVKSYTRRKGR